MDWDLLLIQVPRIAAAFLLCALIGLERQVRRKPAGIRTHALVGVGACLFTLVSAYGFAAGVEGLADPARIAAQVVSGIGFLGAGVIFVNNDLVRGLTTAATVWVSAAVGMACGAGLVVIAAVVVAFHYLLVFALSPAMRRWLVRVPGNEVDVVYRDGTGALRQILGVAARMDYVTTLKSSRQFEESGHRNVRIRLRVEGGIPVQEFLTQLTQLESVTEVRLHRDSDDD